MGRWHGVDIAVVVGRVARDPVVVARDTSVIVHTVVVDARGCGAGDRARDPGARQERFNLAAILPELRSGRALPSREGAGCKRQTLV